MLYSKICTNLSLLGYMKFSLAKPVKITRKRCDFGAFYYVWCNAANYYKIMCRVDLVEGLF